MSGLLLDIALPLVGFYLLHGLGASDWLALLVATAAAGSRLLGVALYRRHVSWFAAIMLAVFGVGFALAFVGGDARFLLLKDSFTTALVGAVFLVSLVGERPLTLSAAQTSKPGQAELLAQLYRTEPAARRVFRVSAGAWGLGLLLEATVRIPLLYLLPLKVMVGLSTGLMTAAMVTLAGWNIVYVTRTARRHPELRVLLPRSMRA